MLGSCPLPSTFPQSHLFESIGGDALKLYLWLRARARLAAPTSSAVAYLEAGATSADIERVVGVSKNTVTKLARELQALGIASFHGGRTGYRFRVGEVLSRRSEVADLPLAAEVFYLDARLAASSPDEAGRGG